MSYSPAAPTPSHETAGQGCKVFSAEATASTIVVASGSMVHSGTESLAIGP
jgi:hypothetical protein